LPKSANSTTPKGRALAGSGPTADLSPIHNYKRPDMTPRDHLVMMLTAGAQIEHALMVQYLYAAYSIDTDQASQEIREKVKGWRANILSVAREEMGHLLTVQNVLVLLGAPVNFGRQMLPWDHEFYPFPFSLEPLSLESLECFIYAEMPRVDSIRKPAPGKQRSKSAAPRFSAAKQEQVIQEITGRLAKRFPKKNIAHDMHRVGELYDEIIALISDHEKIPDSAFDEASFGMQAAGDDWARGYKPVPKLVDPEGTIVKAHRPASGTPHPAFADQDAYVQVDRAATRAEAVKALRALAAQGEALHLRHNDIDEPSHFERFVQIYEEFKTLKSGNLVHAVPRNPTTRIDFHKLKPRRTTYIGVDHHDEVAAHYFAQLFNQRYRLLLSYLSHSFRLARMHPLNEPSLRGMVMHRAFGEMYNLKAIAGLLVRLPRHGGGRAGPPFEMPYTLDLPHSEADIWLLHRDLIAASQKTCSEIFRLAKAKDYEAVNRQIVGTGGDVYLRTLMKIDVQTVDWINKIVAGHGSNERTSP